MILINYPSLPEVAAIFSQVLLRGFTGSRFVLFTWSKPQKFDFKEILPKMNWNLDGRWLKVIKNRGVILVEKDGLSYENRAILHRKGLKNLGKRSQID